MCTFHKYTIVLTGFYEATVSNCCLLCQKTVYLVDSLSHHTTVKCASGALKRRGIPSLLRKRERSPEKISSVPSSDFCMRKISSVCQSAERGRISTVLLRTTSGESQSCGLLISDMR